MADGKGGAIVSQPKRYTPFLAKRDLIEMRPIESGQWIAIADYYLLADELGRVRQEKAVLEAKLGWLRLAEHLLIWDGKQWNIRPEHLPR